MNWNAPHLHLLLNHLPVFAFLFGVLALAFGAWRKSREFQIAGAALLLLGALGTAAAFATGERAEDQVENLPGVTKALIHEHEEAAEWARIGGIAAGLVGLAALILLLGGRPMSTGVAVFLLLLGFAAFVMMARTALLGGEIRHTEIRVGAGTGGTAVDDD